MNVEQKAGETQGSGQIDSISHPEATIPKNTVSNWNIRLHARMVSAFDVGIVISHGGSKVCKAVHNMHVQTTRSVNLITVSNNFGFQFPLICTPVFGDVVRLLFFGAQDPVPR